MQKKSAPKDLDSMLEYLAENARQVATWPDWMKDGAYGISYRKVPGLEPEPDRSRKPTAPRKRNRK